MKVYSENFEDQNVIFFKKFENQPLVSEPHRKVEKNSRRKKKGSRKSEKQKWCVNGVRKKRKNLKLNLRYDSFFFW